MNENVGVILVVLVCIGVTPVQADGSFLGSPSSSEREATVHHYKGGLMTWSGITGDWGGGNVR